MPKFLLLYITTKDRKEAKKIGGVLLKKRLTACVNILPKMESMYWWQGKIESAKEALLLVKTRRALVKKTIATVKKLHSYECPCVVAMPIVEGNEDYLRWAEGETERGQKSKARNKKC